MGLQQLLEELLGLDSYIQVNKAMIRKFGLHEAILISELYSERNYWRKQNKLRDDKWFFSTRENLEENTGLTPYYQRDALNNLQDMGIVECKRMDTPAKMYYSIVDDKLLKALTTCDETLSRQEEKGFNDINNNKKETITITNNKKAPVPGALAKHPRNFSKQTLTDDLQSGKDIDEQKKEKKKISEYDKCYKEIDDRYTDKNINSLLHQHLDWSYHSKDPQRLRSLKVFKKRLDELDKLDNKEKVIKQSLQKQWHCFYKVSAQQLKGNTVDNVILESQSRSSKNVEDIIAQRAERNGII